MVYSGGWLLALLIFVANSGKVIGSLLRNSKPSSSVDNVEDVTPLEKTLSEQLKNHEGGVVNSPSGFLCLEVVELSALYSDEDDNERFSCHYKKQGVIMSSKLGDIDGIFNEHFERGSKIFLKGATYEESNNSIQITSEVQFIQLTSDQSEPESRVKSSTGTKTALVFHITSNGRSTTASPAQLSDWVFGTSGDKVNMKSVYAACSFDQLMFTPASGDNIVDGVVEVVVSIKSTEYDAISSAAIQYAKNELGIPVGRIDHLMFALPRGATDGGTPPQWAGLADTPGTQSWYPDGETRFVSILVHELGHNLGLKHSGEGALRYGDRTCMMGIGDEVPDTKKCFNAAKMKQLGWYTNRVKTIDPTSESFSGKIIGVNDYGISSSDHVLVLEIIDPEKSTNLYLSFNTPEGITTDTGEYFNQIIVEQAAVSEQLENGSYSSLVQHTRAGSSVTVSNFSGSGDLTISFERIDSDGDVNYAFVDVQLTSGVVSKEA